MERFARFGAQLGGVVGAVFLMGPFIEAAFVAELKREQEII